MSIKILYHFESDAHFLSEIKDESIISDDKSKIYQWLLYDKYNKDETIRLDFVSMSENKRVFKQGELVFFENNTAILYLENKTIKFTRLQKDKTSNNILINYIVNEALEKNNKK